MSEPEFRHRITTRDRVRAARRAGAPFLIALLVGTAAIADDAPPPAASEQALQVPLNVLVTAIAGWVAAKRQAPIPGLLPEITFVEQSRLAEIKSEAASIHAGSARPDAGVETLALFDPRGTTIFLPRGWTGASPIEVSMLVHEMVHHFQHLDGERFACAAAREKDAYAIQTAWLEAFDTDLERALGINDLFLLLATNCMF